MNKVYIAIDLKSFYASVECAIRNLNPLDTNLVVADDSRTEKTICLAVSPSLKEYGIGGRARLFEVVQKINNINKNRKSNQKSYLKSELLNSDLKIDYIVAKPQMALYIEYSAKIYEIYLKYVSKDDIIVYSIDEVFIDVTNYIKTYNMKAHDLALLMIKDVLNNTGITATAGIGSNLYLAKVAMDILAKKMKPDNDGVRIASLDIMSYRKLLWDHKPLTDFWRIGRGIANRLENIGVHTMGDLARMSINNENLLYDIFGINAELIIDHAWGYEPAQIDIIKTYMPSNKSLGSGQVLHQAYEYNKALLIIKEMADQLSLDLFNKGYYTNQLVLVISYEADDDYEGVKQIDYYGRIVPKSAHGSINFEYTQSSVEIINNAVLLFEKIIDKNLSVRRINISANNILYESDIPKNGYEQLDLFIDYDKLNKEIEEKNKLREKDKKRQKAISNIKEKFGKNSVLKGMNLEEGSTAIDRNNQIGGHKA